MVDEVMRDWLHRRLTGRAMDPEMDEKTSILRPYHMEKIHRRMSSHSASRPSGLPYTQRSGRSP